MQDINVHGKSFTMTDELIQMMDEMIRRGKIELGFPLCSDNGNVISGTHCIGDACSIKIDAECPHGSERIGSFHTHPMSTSEPSIADIALAMNHYLQEKSLGVDCRGGEMDNTIRCDIVNASDVRKNIKTLLQAYEEMHLKGYTNTPASEFPALQSLFDVIEIPRAAEKPKYGEMRAMSRDEIDFGINKDEMQQAARKLGLSVSSSIPKMKILSMIEKAGYSFVVQPIMSGDRVMYAAKLEKTRNL